jgi:hypothetical protein
MYTFSINIKTRSGEIQLNVHVNDSTMYDEVRGWLLKLTEDKGMLSTLNDRAMWDIRDALMESDRVADKKTAIRLLAKILDTRGHDLTCKREGQASR